MNGIHGSARRQNSAEARGLAVRAMDVMSQRNAALVEDVQSDAGKDRSIGYTP